MRIYAFANQKGGVGKTTSCLSIGAALAQEGKRVLLVDMDAQGSLTKCAGLRDLGDLPTVYEVLKGAAPVKDAIRKKERYNVLPSDIRLSGAELELSRAKNRDHILKFKLVELQRDYDYILIDCSPSLSVLTLMALCAADGIILPVAAQYMSLDGISQLLETIKTVRNTRINPSLQISGVIITMYDSRRSLDREVSEAIRKRFPQTFKTEIRINSKLAEAPAFGNDIFEYSPKSAGAAAYQAIANELLEREASK